MIFNGNQNTALSILKLKTDIQINHPPNQYALTELFIVKQFMQ